MTTTAETAADMTMWDGLRQFATLPGWLSAATDPAQVSAALARHVPELAAGDATIEDCDIGQVRIKRDVWTGVYKLSLLEGRSGERRAFALRGTIFPPGAPDPAAASEAPATGRAFGSAEWSGYLPELRLALEAQPPDAALPALPLLTDAERARELLERSISAASPDYADLRIAACAPKIMRYTPGSRCTILYRLQYPAGLAEGKAWPELVVAKTYKGGKGKHAYAGMRALWESPFRREGGVALAEPLAFLPELNVLVQGPIREEQTLQELIASAVRSGTEEARSELYAFVRKAAAGLAGLHRSEARYGPVRTWEDELAEVRSVVESLASAVPTLAEAAAPLLDRLEAAAAAHPADPILVAHGTFRPGQVLIYQGAIGFIDFDSFCQAEPGLDLSLFLRRTKDIALGAQEADSAAATGDQSRARLLEQADAICEVFLNEYAAHVPISRERIALWEALDLFTLVLHSWTKVKPERLGNGMFALEQHLRRMAL
jgi:hypothetical protein